MDEGLQLFLDSHPELSQAVDRLKRGRLAGSSVVNILSYLNYRSNLMVQATADDFMVEKEKLHEVKLFLGALIRPSRLHRKGKTSILSQLCRRQHRGRYRPTDTASIGKRFLPTTNAGDLLKKEHRFFVAQFDAAGERLLLANQDSTFHIFDSSYQLRTIIAGGDRPEWGFRPLDAAVSHSGGYLSYVCRGSGDAYFCRCDVPNQEIQALKLNTKSYGIFSVKFSPRDDELLLGVSDTCAYIYDLQAQKRTYRVEAHKDDVNTVAYIDSSSNIFGTASDDCNVNLFDKRQLPQSIVNFKAHRGGVCHITANSSGQLLLSSGKDQTIKLWDIRMLSSGSKVNCVVQYVGYKWEETLVRCYFSPLFSTGESMVVTGSHDGKAIIYSTHSGEQLGTLEGHSACVRDVAWHPYEPTICTAGWDGCVKVWKPKVECETR